MQIGKLDRRIKILSVTESQDTTGGVIETTTTLADVWAEIRNISATERYTAMADHSAIVQIFRVRWRSDVTPKMQLEYNGKRWQITGIAEVGRRDALDITAEAIL